MEEMQERLMQSIALLEIELYDGNGKILDNSFFESEEDRQNKVNQLIQYKEKLRDLKEGKQISIDIPLLKVKDAPNDVKVLSNEKANKIYPFKIMIDPENSKVFNGVACQIQHLDGLFHDTVVLYKGFSEEFQTDFIVYVDNRKLECSPIFEKSGSILKNLDATKEMQAIFFNQFKNQDPQKINLLGFPRIIRSIGVKQYETENQVNIEKVETSNIKSAQDKAEISNIKSAQDKVEIPNIKSIQDKDGLYHYQVSSLPVEYIISLLKKANPDLVITGKSIENRMPGSKIISIISLSKPLEEINIPKLDILLDSDNPTEKRSMISEIQNRLHPIMYEDFIKQYKPQYDFKPNSFKRVSVDHFIANLQKVNVGANIQLIYDSEADAYKITSAKPLSEIIPVSNPKGDTWDYQNQYGYDKEGYLLNQSQKLIEYECDGLNNCHEKRPYYINRFIVNPGKNYTKGQGNVDFDEPMTTEEYRKIIKYLVQELNKETKEKGELLKKLEELTKKLEELTNENRRINDLLDGAIEKEMHERTYGPQESPKL